MPPTHLYTELAARHEHYCPMSTLGLRIGWAASRLPDAAALEAVYLSRTCAVDGIALALDLQAIEVEERGVHCLQLHAGGQGGWRIELREETLRLAASYRDLPGEAEREALLERLRQAEESDLLVVQRLEVEE